MSASRLRHNRVCKGRLVRLIMRDGSILIDHFEEAKSKYMRFRKLGKRHKRDIQSMTLHKHQPKREDQNAADS